MAKSLNRWTGIGNVTRDPETKYVPSGTAVTSFGIACNDRYKDREGNWQDSVEYVNVKAWARLAEIVSEYVKRGRQVYVEGKLSTTSWDDKTTGKKVYKTEVIANDVILLGGGNSEPAQKDPNRPVTKEDPIDDNDLPDIFKDDSAPF